MNVMGMIWQLILIRIKWGNLPIINIGWDGRAIHNITWGIVDVAYETGNIQAVALLDIEDIQEMTPRLPPPPKSRHLTVIK